MFGKELGRLREEAEEQEQRASRQKEEAHLLENLEREKQVYEKRRARLARCATRPPQRATVLQRVY